LTAANLALTGSPGADDHGGERVRDDVDGGRLHPGTAGGSVGLSVTNGTGVLRAWRDALDGTACIDGTRPTPSRSRRGSLSIDQMSPNPVAISGQANPQATAEITFDVPLQRVGDGRDDGQLRADRDERGAVLDPWSDRAAG
jgi:hypothetical protein